MEPPVHTTFLDILEKQSLPTLHVFCIGRLRDLRCPLSTNYKVHLQNGRGEGNGAAFAIEYKQPRTEESRSLGVEEQEPSLYIGQTCNNALEKVASPKNAEML